MGGSRSRMGSRPQGGARTIRNPGFSAFSWLALLALAVATTWISPSNRDLFVGDETRYARVLHELASSGSLLVLELGGEPYAHKPPLQFWVLLLIESVLGQARTWTYVLPSVLSFMAVAALTALLSRRTGAGEPVVAAAIFATFWLSWGLAQTARMDMLFVVFITAGAILLYESLENGRRGALTLAGAAFGLAVLTKGPMAAVIALFLFGTEYLLRRRARDPGRLRGWLEPVGALVVMAAIPVGWLVAASGVAGAGYGESLLVEQTLGRAFTSWVHAEPPWFYVLRFPLIFFPWFIVVFLAVWDVLRGPRPANWRKLRFLVVWFASVLIPFSLISGKLEVYMLPALVPAAVLSSHYLSTASARRRMAAAVLVPTGLLVAIFVVAALFAPIVAATEPGLEDLARPVVRWWLWLSALAAGAGLFAQWRSGSVRTLAAPVLGLVALVPLVYLVLSLLPLANGKASTVPLIRALERTAVGPEEIGLYWTPYLWARSMPPSLHDVRYDEPEQLTEDPPRVIVVRRDHADDLQPLLDRYRRIDEVVVAGDDFDIYERHD